MDSAAGSLAGDSVFWAIVVPVLIVLFANASFGMCGKRNAPLGMHRKTYIFRDFFVHRPQIFSLRAVVSFYSRLTIRRS